MERIRLPEWVRNLSPGERQIALKMSRKELPEIMLAHHGRRIAKGKRSLATVHNGVCGGCDLHLPTGHDDSRGKGVRVDVCDHCGIFLTWEVQSEVPVPMLSVRFGSVSVGC